MFINKLKIIGSVAPDFQSRVQVSTTNGFVTCTSLVTLIFAITLGNIFAKDRYKNTNAECVCVLVGRVKMSLSVVSSRSLFYFNKKCDTFVLRSFLNAFRLHEKYFAMICTHVRGDKQSKQF